MCGIWGFKAREATKNKNTVQSIIRLADERGGHSHGFYAVNKDGSHIHYKQTGRPNVDLIWSLVKNAVVCIGHSRLVTSGSNDILSCQPIVLDGIALVHNGIVEGNIKEHEIAGFEPTTQNDSELLIPMLRQERKINFAHALLSIKFDLYSWTLVSSNAGLPLETKEQDGVTYFCSKKW